MHVAQTVSSREWWRGPLTGSLSRSKAREGLGGVHGRSWTLQVQATTSAAGSLPWKV